MEPSTTEILVLGAGPGGYTAAFYAADKGRKVTLVDQNPRLGGVCMNVGCIPSKALLHATAILRDSKGFGGGWLLINFGWGLGVYMGVYTAFPSGAHLNPAVTVSQLMVGNITAGQSIFYFLGEFLGAFLGAVLAWVAFKQHFDAEEDAGAKLAVFSTAPAIRSYGWNIATEIIGTFVLIFVILLSGGTPTQIGPLFVALLVVGIALLRGLERR